MLPTLRDCNFLTTEPILKVRYVLKSARPESFESAIYDSGARLPERPRMIGVSWETLRRISQKSMAADSHHNITYPTQAADEIVDPVCYR